MEKYVPDLYQKDVFSINYDNLISRGLKFLIFDLDNTLALISEKKANSKIIELFQELKYKKFKLMIASNSLNKRVKAFADELNVNYICNCKKPKSKKLEEQILYSKFKLAEIAIIGDSMLDDVVCGNKIGITTILTDPLGKKEFPFAFIKRQKEKRIQKKLRDNNLFTKGRYYE